MEQANSRGQKVKPNSLTCLRKFVAKRELDEVVLAGAPTGPHGTGNSGYAVYVQIAADMCSVIYSVRVEALHT